MSWALQQQQRELTRSYVNYALEDYPTLPRIVTSRGELQSILFGNARSDDPSVMAGIRYYIESYVYLRLRLVPARAAWIAIFKGGCASDENIDRSHDDSEWLEETAECLIAMNKAMREMTEEKLAEIFTPEFVLKDLDRIIQRGESAKVLKEANEQRRNLIATVQKRAAEEYDRLMTNVTKH